MVTGRLLVWLGLLVCGIFTLWPDSSVLQVSFPWVLIWQAGMLCLVIAAVLNAWRVGQPFYRLGGLADVSALLTMVAAALATGFSPFPHHSLGYAIHLWGWLMVLYLARNAMGTDPQAMSRLHSLLAWLTVLSVVLSVLLYGGAILLPTLGAQNQVNAFLAEGDRLSLRWLFDFNEIQNRNGVPLGHQNYVAGYLLLGLPLLTARALIDNGWQQKVWLAGIALGAVVFYTTSSRGGGLGLATLMLLALLVGLLRRWSGRIWLLGTGAIAAVLIFSNARLVNLLTTLTSGTAWTQGELFFRAVTASGGWQMGLQQPLTGLGLGSVVQLFQEYRPVWGGRQAEHVFQLHSTPVQVWAELGILGCGAMVLAVLWVVATLVRLHFSPLWRSHREHQILTYGLGGGLLAYFVMALTDTQLDVLAIAGFLLIALASLSHLGHLYLADAPPVRYVSPWRRGLAVLITAFTIAAVIYETPVLAAWQQASLGFVFLDQARAALREQDLSTFQEKLQQFRDRLTRAQTLNPAEPYYPFQLGWNLGDLAMALTLGGQNQIALPLRAEAIAQMEQGIALNPHLEFGHSTVGWLYLQTNQPAAAEPHFRRAIALIPTKRSLHFGLADALLRQQKIPDGIQALADEIINEPIFLTSPLLNSFPWQIYRERLFTVTDERYTELIKAYPAPELQSAQAFLRWWAGRQPLVPPANSSFIAALQGEPPTRPPQTLSELAIAAYYNPKEREFLLTRAYALSRRRRPDELDRPLLQALLTQMNQAENFERWVRSPIPLTSPLNLRYQRERTAFGLLSRNIDGPAPADLYFVHEHVLFSLFFSDLFPLTPATPFMNNRGL